MTDYQPPYSLTPAIVSLVAEISEQLGRMSVLQGEESRLRLRRVNRIRTIHGSLAIEGNTLSETQITAVLANPDTQSLAATAGRSASGESGAYLSN